MDKNGSIHTYPLHSRGVLRNGLQDPRGSNDCRIKEIFLDIRDIIVERAGGVNDGLKGGLGDNSSIEGIQASNVGDNGEVEPVFPNIRMGLLDVLCLVEASHRGDNGVSAMRMGQQL